MFVQKVGFEKKGKLYLFFLLQIYRYIIAFFC
jgi:hypothetical protein